MSSIVADINGTTLGDLSVIKDIERLAVVPGSPRIGACVGSVGKMICVGLNYADHAAEAGVAVPAEPIIFFKATSSICGPDDDLVLPKGSSKVDWEVELGVVIGRALTYADESEARRGIAGYCVINDISERGVATGTRRPVGERQVPPMVSVRWGPGSSPRTAFKMTPHSPSGSRSTAGDSRTARPRT